MKNTILSKMQEKEKKAEKKPAGPAKVMKRNKTTVNLGRNKLNKGVKTEKSTDNKLRKSMAIKTIESEAKKPKLMTMSMRTEPNEKKETTNKKSEKKDNLSKTLTKSMVKSKTVARLSPRKNKRELTPTKKNKKEEKKKEDFKTDVKKTKEGKIEEKKENKKEDNKDKIKKEEKKKDDKNKNEKKKDEKKKEEVKKEEKPKKEDKTKKDDKSKKDDKAKKVDKKDDKKKDTKLEKKEVKKEVKKDKKPEEKKEEKKENKKEDKKEEKKEDKKEEAKPEDKKEETKPEDKKEEMKSEDKKEEIKKEENKSADKKEETKPEELKKEDNKPEEKKEEIKENVEIKKEEPPKKEEPEEKKEEPKITGKPKTILMMKFISILDKFSPYLTDQDIYSIGKTCSKFYKPCLEKLKEINSQKLSKEQKELEAINTGNEKLLTEFTLGKVAVKALENLNQKEHSDYFQNEKAPDDAILLTYRILYQLINKEKDILKEKNNDKFWKLFRENILKNSEKGIGDFIQNEFKNLDFSEENIYRLNCLTEGQEERLGPINIGKKDNTAKFICFLIKEALEYIKIVIGKSKKVSNSEVYKKYLEYIIKKREENQKKLENLMSKA